MFFVYIQVVVHGMMGYLHASTTLISLINVEVGINVEGGIFWKKLVHNSNKRRVEGGKKI